MGNGLLILYRRARERYSNIEILKKVLQRIYHSLREKIIIIRPLQYDAKRFQGFQTSMSFFFRPLEKDKYIAWMKQLELEDEIITQANLICEHQFDLLGSGRLFLGEKINWSCDFKTGHIWPHKYFKRIRVMDLSHNGDIKVPWELSRFQHFAVLGQAYWITGDEKYAREFGMQIQDWIRDNPVEFSVNWSCTMDVAIRAVNWIIGYFYFSISPSLSAAFWSIFYAHLYQTGAFIRRNLEGNRNKHGNNHYLADLTGLFWIGLFFQGYSSKGRKWRKKAIQGMIEEMDYQVNPEGTNFEASIPYHRLTAELFLSTTLLAEKNSCQFPNSYRARLEKMLEVVMYYCKPNGLSPQIGDADDGRLHIFSHYGVEEKRDHRHLLGVAGQYFNRDDFRHFAGNESMDAVWLLGSWKEPVYTTDTDVVLKAYRGMGYFIARNEWVFLMIRCGDIGRDRYSGHSHNDQLSFELNIEGRDIFIDPGTYVYGADLHERNRFRSTAWHNTLQVGEEEQNDIHPMTPFVMINRARARVLEFGLHDNCIRFFGEHQGFFSACNVIHQRELEWRVDQKALVIKDVMSNRALGKVRFIVSDDATIEYVNSKSICINQNLIVTFSCEYELTDIFVSKSYGTRTRSKRIEVPVNSCSETVIQYCV